MASLSVFVACPYTLFPMHDYRAVFAAVKKSYPVDFKFADEQITNQHILEKIAKYIRNADISLYDITGWNPNVALELGIAVGLGKKYFILFNQKIDQNSDVPSDIKGIDRIQYSSNSELEVKLMLLISQEMPKQSMESDSAYDKIKRNINDALRDHPGLNLAKLTEASLLDKVLVQSTVRAMVSNRELKTQGQKRGMIYYTSDTDLRKVGKKR